MIPSDRFFPQRTIDNNTHHSLKSLLRVLACCECMFQSWCGGLLHASNLRGLFDAVRLCNTGAPRSDVEGSTDTDHLTDHNRSRLLTHECPLTLRVITTTTCHHDVHGAPLHLPVFRLS